MIDLQPELRTDRTANPRPAFELVQLLIILQHHATRASHGAAVDHHVAGDDQASTTVGPRLIKTSMSFWL